MRQNEYPSVEQLKGSLSQAIPRMFQGHLQRIFPYQSPLGYSFESLQLSAPCPAGANKTQHQQEAFHGR